MMRRGGGGFVKEFVRVLEPTSERGKRLAALSQQLRALHSALADESADMRQEQLRDCVMREVSRLAPQEREPFLSELIAHFPVWSDGGNHAAEPPATRPAPAAVSAPLPRDPASLAEALIGACTTLGAPERAAIATRLAAAGLTASREVVKEVVREVPSAGGVQGVPAQALNELKRMVGASAEGGEPRADRIVELCTLLSEFVLKLEPWACSYWKDIAPDAKNQIYRSLDKEVPRFLSGDEAVNKEALARSILRLRSLVSLLLKGVMDAGKQFGKDHVARFNPDAVQGAAEKPTFTQPQGVQNWKQYVKLMDGYDAAGIEKRLKGLIAKDVDSGLSQVIR